MNEDALLGQVQTRATLHNRADAERAVQATLQTLAERISAGLAENLAAQLPNGVGEDLRSAAADPIHGPGRSFNREEFIRRVADRAGIDERQALHQLRVVFDLINEATAGVMDAVHHELPRDLSELAKGSQQDGSTGPLN